MINLRILLPTQVFADVQGIRRIVIETTAGSFGLWPRRLDCVAGLLPGILTYESQHGMVYVAVDRGLLIKSGSDVRVSVRHAVSGDDLSLLRKAVKHQFEDLNQAERVARVSASKLEAGLISSMQALRRG